MTEAGYTFRLWTAFFISQATVSFEFQVFRPEMFGQLPETATENCG